MRAASGRRVAKDENRAVCSSGAARWRIGRKKGHWPIGLTDAGIAWGPAPGRRNRGDCGLSLVSGCLSHGVKALSSIDSDMPGLLHHRLASQARATNIRSISLLDSMEYTLRLGDVLSV
jgi:hypothetical protein